MLDIPKEHINAVKAEILKSVERFGYVEVTGLVYQTLGWHWLFSHNLLAARRCSDQPPYNNEYVIYRPRLDRTSRLNTQETPYSEVTDG